MRPSLLYISIVLTCNTCLSFASYQTKERSSESTTSETILLASCIDLSSSSAFYYSADSALHHVDEERAQLLGESIYLFAKEKRWIPITFSDTAVFLYLNNSTCKTSIRVIGDLNNWDLNGEPQVDLKPYLNTQLFAGIYKAPSTHTRVDYQLIINDSLMLDPGNLKVSNGGYGPNSELALPNYKHSNYTHKRKGVKGGTLTSNKLIHSKHLNTDFNYKVYLPHLYDDKLKYPVLFVTDGQEYSSDELGSMVNVTDNLNAEDRITAPIIVFIDPREPITKINRRNALYVGNLEFISFIENELYTEIENNYAISKETKKTGIVGTSLGGCFSADFGIKSNKFGLIAIQSPAFWYGAKMNYNIFDIWDVPRNKTISRIYVDAGTLEQSALIEAVKFKDLIASKGYKYQFKRTDEGHSWGNWRAKLETILIYFFKKNN